jgi:hypothetical protein
MIRSVWMGLAFAAGYLACWDALLLAPVPLPWLRLPAGGFTFATRIEGIGADFYGRLLYSLAAGALAAGAARWVPTTSWRQQMLGAWVGVLLLFAVVITAIGLWGRVP